MSQGLEMATERFITRGESLGLFKLPIGSIDFRYMLVNTQPGLDYYNKYLGNMLRDGAQGFLLMSASEVDREMAEQVGRIGVDKYDLTKIDIRVLQGGSRVLRIGEISLEDSGSILLVRSKHQPKFELRHPLKSLRRWNWRRVGILEND